MARTDLIMEERRRRGEERGVFVLLIGHTTPAGPPRSRLPANTQDRFWIDFFSKYQVLQYLMSQYSRFKTEIQYGRFVFIPEWYETVPNWYEFVPIW